MFQYLTIETEFFEPYGKYTMVFSSVGYETITKVVNCNNDKITHNVELDESVIQINEVEVTAKSEARQIREQAMPIAVITMEELQGTVSDVSDALSKTAGVKIRVILIIKLIEYFVNQNFSYIFAYRSFSIFYDRYSRIYN